MTAYANFDLLITRTTNGYNARVINTTFGQANVDFVLPFALEELRAFSWLSERIQRHLRPAGAAGASQPLDPQSFGARLYEQVFAQGVGKLFVRALDAAPHLRIRLHLNDVPELADLPWEYLYSTDLDRPLALSGQTPLVRYLDLPQPEERLAVPPPLQILAITSNPTDVEPLAVQQELKQLRSALRNLRDPSQVKLERLSKATVAALQKRLRRGSVHILHFMGHGVFDEEQNEGSLVFEDENGAADLVSARQLSTLLHDHGALRLVFLNACEGARSGQTQNFAGVAQKLVQQGVPAVLAMQFAVSDKAAIALAHTFYQAVADGYPADAAVSEARKALYVADNALEWGTPVFFSRAVDNQIIQLEPPAPPPPVTTADDTQRLSHEGITIQIDNSTITGSSFNISQGRAAEPAASPVGAQSSKTAAHNLSAALTVQEGQIRRIYRQIIEQQDRLLFSTEAAAKQQLETQVKALVQQLQPLLLSYQEQARVLVWKTPDDIQTALDRFGK